MPRDSLGSVTATLARRSRLLVAGLLLISPLGCESSTEPPVDIPEGVAVTLNGTVVARVMSGVNEGGVHVHVGEYSGVFVVSVLNGRGEWTSPPIALHVTAC